MPYSLIVLVHCTPSTIIKKSALRTILQQTEINSIHVLDDGRDIPDHWDANACIIAPAQIPQDQS